MSPIPNNKVFLAYASEYDQMDPATSFLKPQLLGGSVEYDIDMTKANCGCDADIYLVALPAISADGQYDNTDGYWYCGANYGKAKCPEFDIMEGNKYGFHTAAHPCDAPTVDGHYETCSGHSECFLDQNDYGGYGPGADVIDSDSTFHVKVNFNSTDDMSSLASFVVTLSQDGRSIVMDSAQKCTDPSYIASFGETLKNGMAIVMSIWSVSGSRTWLEHNACSGTCTDDSINNISNI
jgi:hypothetical protein